MKVAHLVGNSTHVDFPSVESKDKFYVYDTSSDSQHTWHYFGDIWKQTQNS